MSRLLRIVALTVVAFASLGASAFASSRATILVGGNEARSFDQSWGVGPLQVAFNGFRETIYYGQYSTPASIASSIAGQFTRDYLKNGLCVHASGSTVTFILSGSTTFGTLAVTGPDTSFYLNSAGFAAEALPTSPKNGVVTSTINMTGGWDAGTFYDSGLVNVHVSGATASVDWNEGATPGVLASTLASAINTAAGGFVSAGVENISGSSATINLTSVNDGPAVDASVYGSTTDTNTLYFTIPSFTVSTQNMNGGAYSAGAPLYSFVIPDQGGYDANGNLLTVNDSVMGKWTYSYDNLNRLIGSQAPASQPSGVSAYYAGVQTTWGYDAFGNRLSETQGAIAGASPTATMPASSSATFTSASNQLVTSTMASAITYDAAGDITYDGTNYYLYDAEGRICAVKNSNNSLTGYVYDAAGIRVAKGTLTQFTCDFNPADTSTYNGFGTTTSWVLGPSGEQVTEYAVSGSTQTWTHTNAFVGGKLLATYHDTDTYFALEDWLGTKRAEISAGGLSATYRSLAYGNGLVSSGSAADATEHHFTGKERDAESGNDYFGARYYSSNLGRFMSPDWSAKEDPIPYAKQDDPQTLNLYGYVGNNPLVQEDHDGHAFGLDDLVGAVGGAVVGVGAEVVKDMATGQKITAGAIAGAAVGGAIMGEGIVNMPETLGGSAVAAAALKGAVQGAVSNGVQQAVDIATGDQKSFSGKSLAVSTAIGAATGGLASKMPALKVAGITSGRGNMKAVAQGVATKIEKGTASSMSLKTAAKGAIGGQVADAGKTVTQTYSTAVTTSVCNANTGGGCK